MFCNSRTSVIAEFVTSNFIFIISYLGKKRLKHISLRFLFSSLFGKTQQKHSKFSTGEKWMLINDLAQKRKLISKFITSQTC